MSTDHLAILALVFSNTFLAVGLGYVFGRFSAIEPMWLERILHLQDAVATIKNLIRVIGGTDEIE